MTGVPGCPLSLAGGVAALPDVGIAAYGGFQGPERSRLWALLPSGTAPGRALRHPRRKAEKLVPTWRRALSGDDERWPRRAEQAAVPEQPAGAGGTGAGWQAPEEPVG